MAGQRFDPFATLEALEERSVTYVVVGAFARVIQGTDESRTASISALHQGDNPKRSGSPSTTSKRARRRQTDRARTETFGREPVIEFRRGGEVKIVPAPAGTRGGYDDLRRAASANHSAEASDPSSPRSATSPAWPPPSTANKT